MALVNSTLALDFAQRIAERTELFQGRGWVFKEVGRWLAGPDEEGGRVFLLTGEPGSGKSAITGRLVQFSQGSHTPPDGSSQLKPGFLSAIHLCSARDSNWIDPHNFARSLALQLAARYTEYAKALPNVGETAVYKMSPQQTINQVTESTVIGINININLAGLSARDAFNRAVLDPLRSIYNNGFNESITILVDALDESLSYEEGTTILNLISRLDSLPPQVRFIFTSRNDERVTNEFLDANVLYLSSKENEALNQQDIADYVLSRLKNDERLAAATANLSAARLSEIAAQLTESASGNFLYVVFVLNAVARGQRSLEEMDELPAGLDKLYYDSLNRVVKLGHNDNDWGKDYAPLMGTLSVAREPMSFTQLQSFLGVSETTLDELLRDLRQFMETVPQRAEGDGETFRLYHQSVVDFLHRPMLADEKKQLKNSYFLRPVEWHRRIADTYLKDEPVDWSAVDDYGLRHVATHLAEVAQANREPQQKAERHRQTERLARVVMNKDFQEAHRKRIKDLAALQRDIEQALKSVSVDDHKDALFLAVETAIAFVAFRRERLRPEQLFELARRGEIEEAERQLELYSVEREWQVTARLIIAWLASHNNPAGARKLSDQATQNAPADPTLDMLRERLEEMLAGTPAPPYYLPPAPPAEAVEEMVRRFGGLDANVEMLEGFKGTGMGDTPPSQAGDDTELGFAAEKDGPLLVSFAVAQPVEGAAFLNDYLSVHTNYSYAYYRNRSLWALLNSILRHPQPNWVEALLPVMASTALSGSVLEFQEALPLTVLGLQAGAGDSQALQQLLTTKDNFIQEAEKLMHGRGQGDTWGSHKRRLAAIAEVFSVLLGNSGEAANLLGLASSLPYGFAGFQSPTCLSLAESIRICSPENTHHIQTVLDAAQRAAHNIQETTFCARLTARYNAIAGRWWPQHLGSMPDVENVIKRFRQNPSDPEFAARHIVGEQYEHRSQGGERLPLPIEARQADTLAALAQLYQRPLSEFQRLNYERGWAADEPLPPDTEVNVPDAGFATQLAVRFAAEVLADDSFPASERVSSLQSLVPLTARNSTTLDCMLSRLLLAARPTDSALLENIGKAAHNIQEKAATTVLQFNNEMLWK